MKDSNVPLPSLPGSVGIFDANRTTQRINQQGMDRNRELASIFGPAGGAQVAATGSRGTGNLLNTLAATAGQGRGNALQQRFMSQLAQRFGLGV